jgi:endonuclease III
MDLASSLCLPRIPLCDTCPLRGACKARHLFSPDRLAHTLARKKTVKTIEARHAEKKFPDRIYRGRILAWVRLHGKTRIEAVGPRIDGTYDPIADRMWLKSMAQRLATDGLLRLGTGDTLSLPKS